MKNFPLDDDCNTDLGKQIWSDSALLEALSQSENAAPLFQEKNSQEQTPEPEPTQAPRHPLMKAVWPIAASVLFVVLFTLVYQAAPSNTLDSIVQQAHWNNAKQEQVVLPEGSSIMVNVARQLNYRIDEHQRRANLSKGEAFFSVTKDQTKPFVVDTSLSKVTVLGTKFNLSDTEYATELEVYEGLVEFSNHNGDAIHVPAGQGARISMDGVISKYSLHQEIPLWQEGWLHIDERKLNEAVELLNRYSDKRILLGPGIAKLEVSGRFSTESVKDAVILIAKAHNLSVEYYADSIVLMKR
ncbi:MAG: hypothetical protein AXW14_10870 [Alteromonas sp. Nap_26]|nr:MAG: hypothetical protein AXW14_10870 [Alteromonas sp. Nap_26]